LRSSTLDSLHTGVSPGSIGCAYTYSGLLEKRRFLYNHSGDFPQVILIVYSHVPNNHIKKNKDGYFFHWIRLRGLSTL
jgi:hypothetical protein